MRKHPIIALPLLAYAAVLWSCSGDSTAPIVVGPDGETVPRAAVALGLAPYNLTLADGGEGMIAASPRDHSGALISGLAITWSSSDTTVAAVANDGMVTARHPGTAQVTATLGELSATADVLVNPAATHIGYVDGTGQEGISLSILADSLIVRVLDRQGEPMVGASVAFTPTAGEGKISPTAATTDATGHARAEWTLRPVAGEQTAEARGAGLKGSPVQFSAMAAPRAAASIGITTDTVHLAAIGATADVKAVARDSSDNVVETSVTWSSLDAAVATVGATGLITAIGAGTTRIVVASGELADTAIVVVARAVAAVVVTPPSATLGSGETLELEAIALDSDGVEIPRDDFTWRSLNEAVATVSPNGEVTAIRPGTATIGVRVDGVSGTVAVVVPGPVNK
jgi:uncharacterized protein YjdB